MTAILFALSLCADCFAVSLCSGITMGKVTRKDTLVVASAFAVIQTAFLMIGWAFGSAVAPLIGRVAPWIGFLLLLYVGGSMVLEGIKGEAEALNLNGFRNIVLGGLATSIDALAAGMSMSLSGESFSIAAPKALAVLVVTFLSVVLGITSGKVLADKVGRIAEIIGGLVLIGLGISILLKKFFLYLRRRLLRDVG